MYLHLNDLLDGLPENASPDAFAQHAATFLRTIADEIKTASASPYLRGVFRDTALLQYVLDHVHPEATKTVALIDEVEQAYASLV